MILPLTISTEFNNFVLAGLQVEMFFGIFILPFVLHLCLTNIPVSIEGVRNLKYSLGGILANLHYIFIFTLTKHNCTCFYLY